MNQVENEIANKSKTLTQVNKCASILIAILHEPILQMDEKQTWEPEYVKDGNLNCWTLRPCH